MIPVRIESLAADIEHEHGLAVNHAQTAIKHAKRAGELLLQVKAGLPHGTFLPWVAANLTISARQAQRYMRAAQGKPLPARKIAALPKCDTASYLPEPGKTAVAIFASRDDEQPDWIEIEPISHAPGFFLVAAMVGMTAHYTKKGVRGDYVARYLHDILPGRYTAPGVDALAWQYIDGQAGLLEAVRGWEGAR